MPFAYQQTRSFSWHSRASTEASSLSRNPLRPYKNIGEKVGEQLAFSSPPFPTTERAERRGDPDLTKNEAKLQNERLGMDVAWMGPHGAENIPADRPEETYIPNKEGGGGMGSRRVGGESRSEMSNSASTGSRQSEEEKRQKAEKWQREGENIERIRLEGREAESAGDLGDALSGSVNKKVSNGADVASKTRDSGYALDGGFGTSTATGGSESSATGVTSGSTGGATGRGAAENGAAGLGSPGGVGGAGGVGSAAGPGGVGGAGGTGSMGKNNQQRSFSTVAQKPQGTSNTDKKPKNDPKAVDPVPNRDNGRERMGRDESDPAQKAAYEGMKTSLAEGQSAPNYSNPTETTFRRDQATREHSEFAKNRVVGQAPQAKTK